jgi:hypothetical protein
MTRMTKALLVLTVLTLVAGFLIVAIVGANGGATALFIVLPAGAVLFGLFLISLILEKEMSEFDREREKCLRKCAPEGKPESKSKPKPGRTESQAEHVHGKPLTESR